jgi:hypothetical protein
VGLIDGIAVAWAVLSFCFWFEPTAVVSLLLFGVAFHIALATRSRTQKKYTPEEIHGWIPAQKRASASSVAFDNPITDWKKDAVGREGFVETVLGRVLVDGEPAVGITAAFGEGKSSVLHLIHESIGRGQDVIVVPFRTWLPGSEATFTESLFDSAIAALRRKFFLVQWDSTLSKFGRIVSGAAPRWWGFFTELLFPESQSAQIEELKQLFSRLPVRVVLLLDEIDRMHLEELTVLLKVLRGAPEIPNVSYICAFSQEALARVIDPKEPAHGCEYLEKFFPVQLQLPKLDPDVLLTIMTHNIDRILRREQASISEAARKSFGQNLDILWHQLLARSLTNFRTLGQVLRSFETSLHTLQSEVNLFDLWVIELVRLLAPSTHNFVYRSRNYFYDAPFRFEKAIEAIGLDSRERQSMARAAFDAHFGALTAADRDLALNLLGRVFASVRGYMVESLKLPRPLVITGDMESRRIQDPEFFLRYFIRAVQATSFGELEMDRFISSIYDADQPRLNSVFDATYPAVERDDLRRIDFIRRLRGRVKDIPKLQLNWVARRIAQLTSEVTSDAFVYIQAEGLVLECAARFQGSASLQKTLLELIADAGSNRFASDVVFRFTPKGEGATELVTDWTGVDAEELKTAYAERMRSRYKRPELKPLQLSRDDVIAFARWKFYVPVDQAYIASYFQSALESDIKNLGIFLHWVFQTAFTDGTIKFVDSLYPVEKIVRLLADSEAKGMKWEGEQDDAVQRFRQLMKEEGQPSPAGPGLPT